MTSLNSYLTFNGNCREAMTFYAACLGGQLTFQTIDELPMAENMPTQMKEHIFNSTLINDDIIIMASDMVGENGLTKGNAVTLLLNCSSEEEIKICYEKLSVGGEVNHSLENTFWGAIFGDLTDKYGINWMLNYTRKTRNN